MEDKLLILLVEDDPVACQNFANLIDNSDDMSLVGVTNNAVKAVEYIKTFLPDVIILDLELHHGGGNGLEVLIGLRELSLSRPPYILITTNNSSAMTYDSARNLGADYIMSKHEETYNEQYVLNFLKLLNSVIKGRKPIPNTKYQETEAPAQFKKRLERRIMAELNHVGISQKAKGYHYLVEAIMITFEEPKQNLCSIIGKNHDKTESSVERAMQNAINRAWAKSPIEDLLQYYTAKISSAKGVPTLTEFIYYYANKLNTEY